MNAIPYAAPVAPVTHGLLYTPSTDLLGWALGAIIALACLRLLPDQFRESAKALWAPVGRWIATLEALLDLGLWGWTPLCVLEAFRGAEKIFTVWLRVQEQLVRLAFRGFLEPILT